jgi:uncharacterized protein (DUF2235 family)
MVHIPPGPDDQDAADGVVWLGTWEDGTSEIESPPSNITRISRALKQHARVEKDGVIMLIPQITYYQKGVGTGLLDQYIGGKLKSNASLPRLGH